MQYLGQMFCNETCPKFFIDLFCIVEKKICNFMYIYALYVIAGRIAQKLTTENIEKILEKYGKL